MAIFHLSAQIISRSSGRSCVAAAAYRSGEKLHSERDGITHDYTHKLGVVYSEIMLPDNAPREYFDRSTLWNAVEKFLKRKDAQTAREMDIALPVEFDRQEQIEVLRKYIQKNFVDKGMCADFAIHDKGDGNPHAHIMLTKYEVTEKGFGRKNNSWDEKSSLLEWRENWARICNEKFQAKGLDERIDHRTLEAQGIDREPTIHIGVAAKAMERAGRNSDRMREYRKIVERNEAPSPEDTAEYMHELKEGYVILDKEISVIKQQAIDTQSEKGILEFKAEKITEHAEEIHTREKRIEELRNQRKKMSVLASKKDIDKDIQRLEHSQEQAISYFKRNYYVPPEQAASEVKRLEYKAKDMERIQERLQDKLTPLVVEKEVFALEYQRQKLLAEISPDGQRIQGKLTQLDKEARLQRQSVQDEIARAQSERKINIVTERDFQEILKDVSPEQEKALIAQREREKERERYRSYGREFY